MIKETAINKSFHLENKKLIKRYLLLISISAVLYLIIEYFYNHYENIYSSTSMLIVLVFSIFFYRIKHLYVGSLFKTIIIAISIFLLSYTVYLSPFIFSLTFTISVPLSIYILLNFKKHRNKALFLYIVYFIVLFIFLIYGMKNKNEKEFDTSFFVVNIIQSLFVISYNFYFFIKKVLLHREFTDLQYFEQKNSNPNSNSKLIEYAYTNLPKYKLLFAELYPNFLQNLSIKYSNLTAKDIHFCSLLLLGFSSKQISEIMFLTIRSVQSKKNLLRKKMQLPEKEDLYLIMEKLNNILK